MKLTGKEARDIVYDDYNEEIWEESTKENIIDQTRWSIIKEKVFKHIPTNKYYRFNWSEGATEQQDEMAYEFDGFVEPVEVIPKEIKTIKYVIKK